MLGFKQRVVNNFHQTKMLLFIPCSYMRKLSITDSLAWTFLSTYKYLAIRSVAFTVSMFLRLEISRAGFVSVSSRYQK